MESNGSNDHEFVLDLPDALRSLAFFVTDEDGVKQLRFDPPVYQARYSAINTILKKKQWIPHIKKVASTRENETFFGIDIDNLLRIFFASTN